MAKFTKPAPKAAPSTPVKKKSKYSGVKSQQPRTPMPRKGEYLLRLHEVATGHNPKKGTESHKLTLEVVEILDEGNTQHAVGDFVQPVFITAGPGHLSGLPRVKAATMAIAGYDDEQEYDAFDPDGFFIDATAHESNDFSTLAYPPTEEEAAIAGIIGRVVYCKVTKGNDIPDSGGDYYREYEWGVVPDEAEEQDMKPKITR